MVSDCKKLFQYYKSLADQAMAQVDDAALTYESVKGENSIQIIVQHLYGNMLSRWTDFLTSDGEKPWRNRDAEFELQSQSRQEMLEHWEQGWQCLWNALDNITPPDLERLVYIRNQGHTVFEALHRQLAHYAYHVGQIVMLCKMYCMEPWKSLSIPKGASTAYNAQLFSEEKTKSHFTKK